MYTLVESYVYELSSSPYFPQYVSLCTGAPPPPATPCPTVPAHTLLVYTRWRTWLFQSHFGGILLDIELNKKEMSFILIT